MGIDAQVAAAKLFLSEVGKAGTPGRENLDESSLDPRFIPYNTLINYQVGSDTVDIDRVYGTVDQKIRYPEWVHLFTGGYAPGTTFEASNTNYDVPASGGGSEHFGSYAGDQFYDNYRSTYG